MKNNLILAILAVVLGAGAGFAYLRFGNTSPAPAIVKPDQPDGHADGAHPAGEWCAGHQIAEADCPWCKPSLIEARGMCPEHGVPEALCSRCNMALIAGFKVQNDWCAGHDLPESQCLKCKAGDLPADERE